MERCNEWLKHLHAYKSLWITSLFLMLKYLAVCSNGREMFERLDVSELPKLALNAVLDYLLFLSWC